MTSKTISISLLLLFTVVIFHFSFGFSRVNPHFVEWLYNGDPGTHYLGWAYFNQDPWNIPLGKTLSYGYPVGTNIGLTDSIPFAALFFKLFHSLLKMPFQYFGLWIFSNFLLQGFAGYYLAKKNKATPIQSIFFGLVLVMSVPFLYRTDLHFALSTQWPLVLGFAFLGDTSARAKKIWFGLILFLSLVHPYLWAMMMMIYALHIWLTQARLFSKETVTQLAIPSILSLLIWFALGTLGGSNVFSPGIGAFSATLSSLFAPQGFSLFFNYFNLPSHGTSESLSYLGLGGIILLFFGICEWMRELIQKKSINAQTRKKIVFLFVVCFISMSFVVSWGDVVFVDLYKMMRLTGATLVLSIFRATGRFIWIIFYASLVWSFIILIKKLPRGITPVLAMVVFLQFWDLQPMFNHIRYNPELIKNTTWFNGNHWKSICTNKKHIIFFPYNYDIRWLRYAYECGATVNIAYSARAPKNRDEVTSSIFNDLLRGNLDHESVAILSGESFRKFKEFQKQRPSANPAFTTEEVQVGEESYLVINSK